MSVCSKCGVAKPQDEFKLVRGQYRPTCKECHNRKQLAWARANKERRSAIMHKSYAKSIGKNPDECHHPDWHGKRSVEEVRRVESEQKRAYYQRHRLSLLPKVKARAEKKKESIRTYQSAWNSIPGNRERKNIKVREWRASNLSRVNELSNARRARKLRAQPRWLNTVHLAQIQEMYDIAQCRSMQTGIKHHVDHIFPLQHKMLGGLHVPWNLQVLEGRENLRKHRRVPAEFAHMMW